MKVVFFGSGSYTIPVIEKLIPHGLNLIITTEKQGPITDFCKKNNIEVICARTAKDLSTLNSQLSTYTLGILASFGVLIPDEIIDIFPNGIINIHPSLLPKWKGPSPIQYTLLNGDTQTGVTIIKLDNEIDHGPILSQKEYELDGTETTDLLLNKLFSIGADMVKGLVIQLENGEEWKPVPQDHSKETWSEELSRESGKIDIDKLQTINYKLDNMVRAFYPWPGTWLKTRIKNQESRIKLLPNEMIQVEGKNPMNYKDFVNGYGDEGKEFLEKIS